MSRRFEEEVDAAIRSAIAEADDFPTPSEIVDDVIFRLGRFVTFHALVRDHVMKFLQRHAPEVIFLEAERLKRRSRPRKPK